MMAEKSAPVPSAPLRSRDHESSVFGTLEKVVMKESGKVYQQGPNPCGIKAGQSEMERKVEKEHLSDHAESDIDDEIPREEERILLKKHQEQLRRTKKNAQLACPLWLQRVNMLLLQIQHHRQQ